MYGNMQTAHRDGFVDANEILIHYIERGKPTSPPIVLLHGLGECARNWDRVAENLAAEHHVFALDFRGHGESARAGIAGYSVKGYVADVASLVETPELDGFVLVGHGEGGRVAVAYAARHPLSVEAVVAAECSLEAQSPVIPGATGWGDLDEVVDYLRAFQPKATIDALEHQAEHMTREASRDKLVLKCDPAVFAQGRQDDLWADWRRLKCPALVVRGRQSKVLPHDEAVKMKEALQYSRLAELEDSGHWVHQEAPGAFVSTVRWFLGGLRG